MECDICHRGHDAQKLPFLCPVDARNRLYEGRMQNLQLLVENESIQSQLSELSDVDATKGQGALQQFLGQQRITEDRTDQILAAAHKLKEDIESAREEIRARRTTLSRRRSDFVSVSDGLMERRAKQYKELEKSAQVHRFRWAQKAEATANTRAFLCTEALRLYGLKRSKKLSSGRYEYHLARVPIIDLTAMDSFTPDVLSTSLAHVAHILTLVCHYLSIRLPAEITLPHRDYPRPTIFNLNSSYQHFHSSPNIPGSSSSPFNSREPDSHRVPRPRPLSVDRPLSQLAKEDPSAYSFFLEGVTLLAYNVAWLCSSQGVAIGDPSNFEDICNIGRNLYSFLMSAQAHDFHTVNIKVPGWEPSGQQSTSDESQGNWLGRYTHGGTFYFLGGPDGTELIRTFKLPSPMKLADKLKRKLIGDAPTPDWEVLGEDAWKIEDEPIVDAIANGRNLPLGRTKTTETKLSPRTGSNGWTKVKHR